MGDIAYRAYAGGNRPCEKMRRRVNANNLHAFPFAFQVCIKSADLAHAARATPLHLRWTRSVIDEFFLQARRHLCRTKNRKGIKRTNHRCYSVVHKTSPVALKRVFLCEHNANSV